MNRPIYCFKIRAVTKSTNDCFDSIKNRFVQKFQPCIWNFGLKCVVFPFRRTVFNSLLVFPVDLNTESFAKSEKMDEN